MGAGSQGVPDSIEASGRRLAVTTCRSRQISPLREVGWVRVEWNAVSVTMKGRGPRPTPDARDEFVLRLRAGFRWVGSSADVTGWWRSPELVAGLGPALAELAGGTNPDVVVAPQSRGTLIGALVARHLGIGLIELCKEVSRLADSDGWLVARTPPDYRDRNLELGIRADLLAPGTRILFVDDWIDTGGQLQAAHAITSMAHAHWGGTAVIVDALADPRLRRDLAVRSLVRVRDL